MNKKNSTGAGLFMMEMLAAVFFFILCAATCLMAFVKADQVSRLARDTNQAVVLAESLAEVWKQGGADLVEEVFSGQEAAAAEEAERSHPEAAWAVFWDANGNPVEEESQAAIVGTVFREQEDGLETAHITMVRQKDEKTLFSMTAARYLPAEQES